MVARASGSDAALIDRRLEAIAAFYAPLGGPRVSARRVADADASIAVIDFDGRSHDLTAPGVFGAQLPAALETSDALLAADDDALRLLDAPLAAVAATGARVRIVTACCPPTMLYEAHGPGVVVWSSHAVAAAYLASGKADLDDGVLAEFLAAQFVGGERTLVREAAAVGTATVIDLSAAGVETRSYWPLAARWSLVDPARAQAHAEDALMATLPRQVERYARPFCGITGGLDSGVAAVALAEAGVSFEGLTFGESDWPDVRAAPGIAHRLGVPTRTCLIEWTGDDEALRTARAEVRWHEGAIQLGIGRIPWPSGMSAWVTGGGGETGRAFYYRERALAEPDPSPTTVAETLAGALLARIDGAGSAARDAVRRAVDGWIAEAHSVGVDGWRALDLVYSEQRVRRWLRGMLTHRAGPTIPAFTAPEVQRGLASLSLAERTSDGFHREFLARRAPELASRAAAHPVPPLRRRLLARLRPRAAPSLVGERWREHPRFRAWIADEILRSPTLAAALGEHWCEVTREGFLVGDGTAEANALWAAGPIALESELASLPR